MTEPLPEIPPVPAEEPAPDDGNVALPVPVDSAAGTAGDGGSSADTLPPSLPG
ncbi:hypothetical protein V2W30_20945 [Streptomyces sp. Q6]|uniref:Uncharacterized protein n=1 Tax=Streptomyces citrinus TaxID=3118173 RepID=A0ACD5AE85_9ACTN